MHNSWHHPRVWFVPSVFGVIFAAGFAGCGSDSASLAPTTLTQTYWAVTLDQHAVTLALTPPYNTIQLHTVARNPNGDSIAAAGPAHYTAADSSVTVDANGFVTARYETVSRGTPTRVVVSIQDSVHRITHSDTTYIQVTSTAPATPLASLSIQPVPPDSAIRAAAFDGTISATLTPALLDTQGEPMSSDILVAFTSSDSTIASIIGVGGYSGHVGGEMFAMREGIVTLHATTWAYGVAKQDSLRYTITEPKNVSVYIVSKTTVQSLVPVLYFFPQTISVGVGGIVTWDSNGLSDSIDVVFDDPTHVDSARARNRSFFPYTGSGNFSGLFEDTTAINNGDNDTYVFHRRKARAFPVAGTYHYRSARYGSTGTVVVR